MPSAKPMPTKPPVATVSPSWIRRTASAALTILSGRAGLADAPQRLGARLAAAPVLDHERDRRAAFVEAAVLQTCELEGPGQQQRSRAEHPGVGQQPGAAIETAVQPLVECVRGDAEG